MTNVIVYMKYLGNVIMTYDTVMLTVIVHSFTVSVTIYQVIGKAEVHYGCITPNKILLTTMVAYL